MADHTHSFIFKAGVLEIIDNATEKTVVCQPTNPNTGLGWASEADAIAYGQQEFGHLYQVELPSISEPSPPVDPLSEITDIDTTSTSTITVGTGE